MSEPRCEAVPVILLDGNTFMVSDQLGDCHGVETEGFFFRDTRFLSVYRLRLNGQPLRRLSVDTRSYYAARFFLTLPATVFVNPDISVMRDRALGRGVHEDVHVFNHRNDAVTVTLEMELEADFRDLFAVKEDLPPLGSSHCECEANRIVYAYEYGSFKRQTLVDFTEAVELVPGKPNRAILRKTIAPKQSWHLCVRIIPVTDRSHRPKYGCDTPQPEMQESFEQWLNLPKVGDRLG
jgi:hypothetical protein